jgi:BirA family biotin operon repressor/biotin-[acetyl-CoA-carboxylase] ligase
VSPLDLERLRGREKSARHVGRRIEYLPETTSTNDWAHRRAADPDSEGLVLIADHQTAGRGQRGRTWTAPPGAALLFSVVLHPGRELATPHFLTAWAAAAVAEAIQAMGLDARIKWPNDVLIAGRKVCGVLVERRMATVVGVGLNVAVPPESFPENLRIPATSLATELGREADRTQVFLEVLQRLDDAYADALQAGPQVVWRRWPALAENLVDRPVLATTSDGAVAGTLVELRPDRGARVQLSSGNILEIPPEQLLRVEPCNPDAS